MEKRILIMGLIILLVFSSVVPISIGYDVSISDIKEQSSNHSNTLYVGGSGPNNYTTIQSAIDAANVGDTIYVYSGVYYENIIINKSISLIGKDKKYTTIDAGGNDDAIYISANHVNIRNFFIQNSGSINDNAGIDINSDYNNITGNIISNNFFGIYIFNSNGNIIYENTIIYCKYGIQIYQDSYNNIIYHNTFLNNYNNAYDAYNNNWDYGNLGGNYWDDYQGEDNNHDYIGDIPYNIPGGENKDLYPLMKPWNNWGPNKPTIEGISKGKPGFSYDYKFTTSDLEEDDVSYYIDWGDHTITDWTTLQTSGTSYLESHTWKSRGTYIIEAKAKDVYGTISDFNTLKVWIPRNNIIIIDLDEHLSNLLSIIKTFLNRLE